MPWKANVWHPPDESPPPEPPFRVSFQLDPALTASDHRVFEEALFQQPLHWDQFVVETDGAGTILFVGENFDADERAEVERWLRGHSFVVAVEIVDVDRPGPAT
jgi:hypothetical protein